MTEKKIIKEVYSDISCIYNNLQDDLQLDKLGEEGYKNETESNKAVRKFTWKVVERICNKWEMRFKKEKRSKKNEK